MAKSPKVVTPADFDFSKALSYRKTATIRADQIATAKGGESVVTRQPSKDKAGTFVETTNTAKPGDKIVTRSPGDSYVIAGDKFGKMWEPPTNMAAVLAGQGKQWSGEYSTEPKPKR